MSVRKGYVAVCDDCHTTARTFHVSDSPEGARRIAHLRGWANEGQVDRCSMCKRKAAA